ncbi:hypothetical protein PoB_001020700 [Plakobranchus ocellatus]|uniref:Uncharacterized protein n=1 Tax=Plakobranchus ocellatus TaxID=259542 RepID=A0AAV3YLB0_9GAST|nr:hypothetical protein PoB_001020700 [Plakobranchus ocellatus]
MISGFQPLHQARAPTEELEPTIEGSLQIRGLGSLFTVLQTRPSLFSRSEASLGINYSFFSKLTDKLVDCKTHLRLNVPPTSVRFIFHNTVGIKD